MRQQPETNPRMPLYSTDAPTRPMRRPHWRRWRLLVLARQGLEWSAFLAFCAAVFVLVASWAHHVQEESSGTASTCVEGDG